MLRIKHSLYILSLLWFLMRNTESKTSPFRSVEGMLKCLVEVDELLFVMTLSSQHTTVPCSVDSCIQLQVISFTVL